MSAQLYPTVDAYEAVCAANEVKRLLILRLKEALKNLVQVTGRPTGAAQALTDAMALLAELDAAQGEGTP